MSEQQLKVGDIVWRMYGHQRNGEDKTEWYAEPMCIEYIDEHKFLSGRKIGGRINSIGKSYFLSREECLADFEANRDKYTAPAITSAMFRRKEEIGSIVPDHRAIYDDDILRVIVDGRLVPLGELPWKKDSNTDEFGMQMQYVTLGAIRERFAGSLIYVWREDILSGAIYQTGNYPNETAWRLHGKTMGYA